MKYVISLVLLIPLLYLLLSPEEKAPRTIQLRYSALISNTSNQPVTDAEVMLFAPGSGYRDGAQITADLPFTEKQDQFLNSILHFSITLSPFGKRVVNVEALAPVSWQSTMPDPTDYLKPERLVESDAPEINAIAKTIKGRSAEEKARAVFEWVRGSVQDEGFEPNDRGALWALREKRGDCTEFTSLSTALLRALGIPARRVGGFVVSNNAVLKPGEYHNWTEFYDRSEWRVLDAQRGVFDTNVGYIPFRILTSVGELPLPNTHRFLAADPRLSVSLQ